LSERRYDEVNEILSRLGKAPVSFIPAAHAANGSDELSRILLETLQSASQHVDYAFLISDEIRDVEKVKAVNVQIRGSLEKQRTFLEKSAPLLKEVKLQETRKSRVRKLKPQPVVETVLEPSAVSETVPVDVLPPPENVQIEPVQNDQIVQNDELALTTLEETLPVVEEDLYEDVDLDDAGSFIEDRLLFQNELLQKIDEVLVDADSNGNARVRLTVVLEPLVKHEDASNGFFKEALTVHYQNTQKILESELRELDEENVSVQIPIDEDTIPPSEADPLVPSVPEPTAVAGEDSSVDVTSDQDVGLASEVPPVLPSVREKLPTEEVLERALNTTPSKAPETDPVIPRVEVPVKVPAVVTPTPAITVPEKKPEVLPEPVKEVIPAPVETPVVVPVVDEKPKSVCEIKAESVCASAEKNCLENAPKECEDQQKKERDRLEQERLNKERSEKMKKELEDIQRKVDELQSNQKNSPPENSSVPEEVKANILEKSQGRKK
jgi:hypothetical protein